MRWAQTIVEQKKDENHTPTTVILQAFLDLSSVTAYRSSDRRFSVVSGSKTVGRCGC